MRKLTGSVLAGVLGLTMFVSVAAQDTASITVGANEGGTFTAAISQAPDFGDVIYSLEDQTVSGLPGSGDDLVVRVTDARGYNNGWTVSISGNDFSNSPINFPISNLTLGGGSVVSVVGPITGIETPGADVQTTAMPLIIAPNLSGTGQFDVTYADNSLTVPAGTLVGEYQSTLVVSISGEAPGGD